MMDIENKDINISDLSPIVLRTTHFQNEQNHPAGYKLSPRYVYDYELEYFLDGSGSIIVNGKNYPVKKGDVMLRRPGQYVQGIMPYTCYFISFDLLGHTGKNIKTYDIENQDQEFQCLYKNPVLNIIPTLFHPTEMERYQELFTRVFKEYINYTSASTLILKALILEIIYQLYKDHTKPNHNYKFASSPHQLELEIILDYIKQNLNKKIRLEQLAKLADLSPNHFHKIFTETLGITPNNYIIDLKLKKAKKLLLTSTLNISEIAMECGYSTVAYFSIAFKKHFNLSPLEYRKRHTYP